MTGLKPALILLAILLVSCQSFEKLTDKDSEDKKRPQDYYAGKSIILHKGVTEKMLSPDFWLKDKDDAEIVITDLDDIEKLNKTNLNKISTINSGIPIMDDLRKLYAKSPSLSGVEILNNVFTHYDKAEVYRKNSHYENKSPHRLTAFDWSEIYSMLNISNLISYKKWLNKSWKKLPKAKRNKIEDKRFYLKKAVALKRTDLRVIPDDRYYFEAIFPDDDIMQNSGILMNEPFLIMNESRDKKWFYVKTSYCTGWIKKEETAFCTDEEFDAYFDWTKKNQESFITITSDEVILSKDYFSPDVPDGTKLFMGTSLHLAKWTDKNLELFNGRIPNCSYLAEIPLRDKKGNLKKGYCAVPASVCTKGFLEFTKKNLLTLAFQSLGNKYGWGGMEDKRDCTEYTKEILACFGFNIPRNSTFQIEMAGRALNIADKTVEEKEKILDTLEAGTFLGFRGHVMLYLGKYMGKYYVINDMGSFYPDKNYIVQTDAYSVNINTLDATRRNGLSWIENLTDIKYLQDAQTFKYSEKPVPVPFNPKAKFAEFSKINSGNALLYKAKVDRKKITVAINAGHGTQGGQDEKTYSHPDKSPKTTAGTNAKGAVFSLAISDGTVLKTGENEADLNLKVAGIVKKELLKRGFDVLMLRDSKDTQLDNVARTVLSNENAKIHISIHFDANSKETEKGVFWCSIPESLKKFENVKAHAKESENLAQNLLESAKNRGFSLFNGGKLDTDLTQTSYSLIPTVDIEIGDQASPTDSESLENRALFIADGIEKYFKNVIK